MATDSALPPCRDFDEVCGNVSDPRYTMDFSDVEAGAYVYWCADCGETANAMNEALQDRFAEEGDAFTGELEAAIEAAERKL